MCTNTLFLLCGMHKKPHFDYKTRHHQKYQNYDTYFLHAFWDTFILCCNYKYIVGFVSIIGIHEKFMALVYC